MRMSFSARFSARNSARFRVLTAMIHNAVRYKLSTLRNVLNFFVFHGHIAVYALSDALDVALHTEGT